MEEKYYWIWLSLIPNIGIKRIKKLLDIYKKPENIYKLNKERLMKIQGIGESITNSIRHGLATVVDIDIYKENNLLCLKIKDNGKGCKAINYGFGLKQMVERVSQIRGDINFYSENGFTTEIKIPL